MQLFDYSDYRAYLKAKIYHGDRARKGALSALAGAIPCQVSYLSRVMAGAADLSAEQTASAAEYFGLSSDESFYFFLLVQLARAGTPTLRTHLKKRIDEILAGRLDLQKRVQVRNAISEQDQARYYGVWYYSAVHVMTGIPELQSKEAMCRELHIPISQLNEILQFLISIGLIKEEPDGRLTTGIGKTHLHKDSPMIVRHHTNWRLQAVRSIESQSEAGIHYSVLINTSKKDAEVLRRMIAQFIESFMAVVHPSADEEMNCFTLDFFKPKG